MLENSINRLSDILDIAPQLLLQLSEEDMSKKPAVDKWSNKQILGHLIDSATNNHQRFVRVQFELNPEIKYDQNSWNKFNFYQELESSELITFWTTYNKHLIEIIKRIPTENLTKQVSVGSKLFDLEFMIIDYVEHLEHHLKQLIDY